MMRLILLISVFLLTVSVRAQDNDCKVLLPRISGSYNGECKKGLAHGKGIAQGVDRYEGDFRKGLPDGIGIYRWDDGTWYEGYWRQGLRNGTGKMTYSADSVLTGFWKADRYAGEKELKSYEILQSRFVARYSFMKISNNTNQVRIKLTLGGSPNTTVQDFSMTPSSGEEYRPGNGYGLQNVTFPLTVRLYYKTWNVMRTVLTDVTFEFRINEPGTWEVTIQN